MKVDYCIVVKEELSLLISHLSSLREFNDMNKHNFHLIYKGNGRLSDDSPLLNNFKIYEVPDYDVYNKDGQEISSIECYDAADAWNYCAENCGNEEAVIIAHSDIEYNNNEVIDIISNYLDDKDIGIVLSAGLISFKREVYKKSRLKFWPLMGNLIGKRKKDNNDYIFVNDPQYLGEELEDIRNLMGIDVGTLFFLEAQINKYRIIPTGEDRTGKYQHIGCGSSIRTEISEEIKND